MPRTGSCASSSDRSPRRAGLAGCHSGVVKRLRAVSVEERGGIGPHLEGPGWVPNFPPGTPDVNPVSPRRPLIRTIGKVSLASIVLKTRSLGGRVLASSTTVGEAKVSLCALCGVDRRRMRDELREFPKILGGGGQQELIFGSVWTAEAQSTEPEYAFQMSEEHLNVLSFAT
jgi:hypothetical protein